MAGAPAGPRVLLRRIREVMAEPVNAQTRLDKIVIQIAANMVAEVCSVYVLRDDGRLELFATEGLNRTAVHLTTMRSGEGLVGLIAATAQPLALSDAQSHPSFSYKPETGEEIYHSFVGVPILRGGNTLGILVVQNRAQRTYLDEEIEDLQTTSMLLAEMIASGELQSIAPAGTVIALRKSLTLKGSPVADGVGLGHVVLHEPRIVIAQLVAEDPKKESARLDEAIKVLRASMDELIDGNEHQGAGEHRDVLETLRLIVNDPGWMRRMREAVMTGLTAEAAVERVQNDTRARLQRSTDPYMRERLHDLDDLANRLLHQLTGQPFVRANDKLPENAILVVLEEGGGSSHVAIVARALGLPVVGDVPNITNLVEDGEAIIIDGAAGEALVRPPADLEAAYAEKARLRAGRQEQYRNLRDTPAVTSDGVTIDLHMNAGLPVELPHVNETGAVSIGLFRTELLFMVASKFPRLEEQTRLYKSILDAVPDKPVTFRTLDIGGDKILPYMRHYEEENPALGWRAVRIGLDRPALLRYQLRAMFLGAAGRDLRIMFPMVAEAAEFDSVKDLTLLELEHLDRHCHKRPRNLQLGVMIEVPSLLWQLDEILERVDFLSVGSNDLMQYLFASDRDNKRTAGRFDALSPSGLRALKLIVDKAGEAGKPVTLCGEMGGKPLEALALVALGYRGLSMSPSSIGPIKAMVLGLDASDARAHILPLLERRDGAHSLRDDLQRYAEEKGVPL